MAQRDKCYNKISSGVLTLNRVEVCYINKPKMVSVY